MTVPRSLPLALASLVLVAGCGGGSGTPSAGDSQASSEGSADLSLGSSGHPELASLRTRVTGVGLVHSLGFLARSEIEPFEVEWIGLVESQRWLGRQSFPRGEWVGMYLTFDVDATRAVLHDGSVVPLATDERAYLSFDGVVSVPPAGLAECYGELDLLRSVELGPEPVFRPVGSATDALPVTAVETLYGVVREVRPDGALLAAAFADAERTEPLGPLAVRLAPGALLVDDTGEVFSSPEAFAGSLRPGLTLLELEGELEEGDARPGLRLRASRVEIIDPALGEGRTLPVRIEGRVSELHAGGFALAVRRVLTGRETAREVLEGLDTPHLIDVAVDEGTRILVGSGAGDAPRPEVGHRAVVEFREFATEPFPADVVVLRRTTRCIRGGIGELQSPEGFTLVVRSHDGTDAPQRVRIGIAQARLELLVRGRPVLEPRDLVRGMAAEVCGVPTDDADSPGLDARRVQVHPGLFTRGRIASFDRASASFTTSTSSVLQSFGAGVSSGPLDVRLREGVRVHGAVDSLQAFFDLLEATPADVAVSVGGKGIGAEVPGAVQLFELEVVVHPLGDGAGDGEE